MYLRLYTYILFLYTYRIYIYIYIYIYICYICINVKRAFDGTTKSQLYLWRNTEHITYTHIFGNERACVSQWWASRMLPRGANFPNCSRRYQTLATVGRTAAIIVDCSRRNGPQMWTALQHFNQCTHVFATAAYANYNMGRGSSVCIATL